MGLHVFQKQGAGGEGEVRSVHFLRVFLEVVRSAAMSWPKNT